MHTLLKNLMLYIFKIDEIEIWYFGKYLIFFCNNFYW